MGNVIIIGSSGHAKTVIDTVRQRGEHRIVGVIDRFRSTDENTMGYMVLGKEEDLPRLIAEYSVVGCIVAIGDNYVRSEVVRKTGQLCPGLVFLASIHPQAIVAKGVEIGEGTVMAAGAIAGPASSIGRHCILNTNSSLDHDSTMADFSSLAPGAIVGGNVSIGVSSAVGIGATICNRIRIGEHTVVGAGSTVLENIEPHTVAYGTPAKVARRRQAGDKYL